MNIVVFLGEEIWYIKREIALIIFHMIAGRQAV